MTLQRPVHGAESSVLSRLIQNSHWNVAAFLVAVTANFVTLPIVVRQIGIANFGAAGILVGMLAPLMLVGTVIAQACVREISMQIAQQRTQEAGEVFWTGIWLCAGGCLVVIAADVVLGPIIAEYFMPDKAHSQTSVRLLCLLAVMSWTLQQFVNVLQSGLAAAQAYRVLALTNACTAVLAAVALVAATTWLPSVEGFLVGTGLGFLITALWSWVQLRKHASFLFPIVRANRLAGLRMAEFGRWQAASQITGAVALQTDRFVLGATSSLSIVGQFNVAVRLQEVVYMGVLKITEVVFPHFAASSDQPIEARVPLITASAWLTNVVAVAVLAPLVPLGAALINLWVGPDAMVVGGAMLRTLVVAGLIGSGMNVFIYFMLGQGYGEMLARINIVYAIFVVLISVILLFAFGVAAAGGGILIVNFLRLGYVVWKLPSLMDSKITFCTVIKTTQTPILVGLVMAFVAWLSMTVVSLSWFEFFMLYAGLACATVTVCVVMGLAFTSSRNLVANLAHGLLTRIRGVD